MDNLEPAGTMISKIMTECGMKRLHAMILPAVVLGSLLSVRGETLLHEPFDVAGLPDPENGLYGNALPMLDERNRNVAGGRIVGFRADAPWKMSVQTSLPRTVIDPGGSGDSPGRLEFRGVADGERRMLFRSFENHGGSSPQFLSAKISTSIIDPHGLFLIAFSSSGTGPTLGNAFLSNLGEFYNGLSFGFKGDETDQMHLILRFRDANLEYIDEVLVDMVREEKTYHVVVRIDWDVFPPVDNPRERVSVWINSESDAENESTTFEAFAGAAATIDTVYLLLDRFGTDPFDAVFVDDLRVGSEFPESD